MLICLVVDRVGSTFHFNLVLLLLLFGGVWGGGFLSRSSFTHSAPNGTVFAFLIHTTVTLFSWRWRWIIALLISCCLQYFVSVSFHPILLVLFSFFLLCSLFNSGRCHRIRSYLDSTTTATHTYTEPVCDHPSFFSNRIISLFSLHDTHTHTHTQTEFVGSASQSNKIRLADFERIAGVKCQLLDADHNPLGSTGFRPTRVGVVFHSHVGRLLVVWTSPVVWSLSFVNFLLTWHPPL